MLMYLFGKNVYEKMNHSGFAPACIYGVSKMRTIFSNNTTLLSPYFFNYEFASFFCDPLSRVVPDDYSYKNTFSFVPQIKNATLSGKSFVSYNATSLFINISLREAIDIAINLISKHHLHLNLSITKIEFRKLFLFSPSQIHFLFNGKFLN